MSLSETLDTVSEPWKTPNIWTKKPEKQEIFGRNNPENP